MKSINNKQIYLDVRESMGLMPNYLQHLLTWITGKPLLNQRQIWKNNCFSHLLSAILFILIGLSISNIALQGLVTIPLLIFGWLFTVSGARKLQVTVSHHCVHNSFTGNSLADCLISEIISIGLIVQNYFDYRKDHVSIHHSWKLATIEDPDLKFLLFLGIKPGMLRKDLWWKLFLTLFSPAFHFWFLYARIKSNLIDAPFFHRILFVVIYALILIQIFLLKAWLFFIIIWIFPLTILYHISALLQFICEHRWLKIGTRNKDYKSLLVLLTVGRFCGEPIPNIVNTNFLIKLGIWTKWWINMFLIHIPTRLFVLVGDLPQHDWHHRNPKDRNWTNAAYARQHDLEKNCPGWPESYTEVWGLFNAINLIFQDFSSMPVYNFKVILSPKAIANNINRM
jgi:hypothetical protein